MRAIVLAKAFKGQPLMRVAVRSDDRNAYLANPDLIGEVEHGFSEPIGFPLTDVFSFESDRYEELLAIWNMNGLVPDDAWTSKNLTSYI